LHELEIEAWENWTRQEFIHALERKFEIDIKDSEEEELVTLFNESADKANEYWCNESGGEVYISVDKVVEVIELADLDHHNIKYESETDDE